jgi:hypothetical protein
MRVQDAHRKGVVDLLREHGAEPGHGDQLHPVRAKDVHQTARVVVPVEPLGEATERPTVHQLDRRSRALGYLESPARAIGDHDDNGKIFGQERFEDAPSARDEHPSSHHGVNLVGPHRQQTDPWSCLFGKWRLARMEAHENAVWVGNVQVPPEVTLVNGVVRHVSTIEFRCPPAQGEHVVEEEAEERKSPQSLCARRVLMEPQHEAIATAHHDPDQTVFDLQVQDGNEPENVRVPVAAHPGVTDRDTNLLETSSNTPVVLCTQVALGARVGSGHGGCTSPARSA